MYDGAYIVQCNMDNFDSVKNLLTMFTTVISVDSKNMTIKSEDINSILKQRIADFGASFWQEREYAIANFR